MVHAGLRTILKNNPNRCVCPLGYVSAYRIYCIRPFAVSPAWLPGAKSTSAGGSGYGLDESSAVTRDLHSKIVCKQSDYRFLFPIPGLNDHRLIALTGCLFQLGSVYNIYRSTGVLNQACLLQDASRDGNARPSRT